MTTTPDLSQAVAERAVAPERSGPTLSQLIARQRDQIAAALPKHMDADRLVRIALTQLRQTPRLGDCTPQSVLGALMLASQLGVEPGPLGQCYLVPFRNNNLGTTECQFILGYKGIIDLAWRSDRLLSIEARDVHAGDAFEYRYGLHPVLDHVPTLNGNRGGVTCYYGLATFKDGGSYFVVVGQPEIDEHRGRSRAANAGPWVTDPVAMAKKTVIRMMVPYLPLSAENIAQLSTDEAVVHEIPLDYHQVADAVDDAPEPVAIEAVAQPAPAAEPEAEEDSPASVPEGRHAARARAASGRAPGRARGRTAPTGARAGARAGPGRPRDRAPVRDGRGGQRRPAGDHQGDVRRLAPLRRGGPGPPGPVRLEHRRARDRAAPGPDGGRGGQGHHVARPHARGAGPGGRAAGARGVSTALVPANLGPGMVPAGFAEAVLARCVEVDDPALLWDAATSCAALAQKWNGHGQEKNEIKSAQMFVEIELGQRLGPPTGSGGDHKSETFGSNSHESLIPTGRATEFRRYHGYRDFLVGLVHEGVRSRRSLLLALDRANAVDVDPEDVDIVDGDFREVLDVELGSVALILTDPPYPAEYLPLWSDLAKWSAEWLEPGGSLVAYCGQSILPDATKRLAEHLRYWWTFALLHQHGTAMIPGKWVSSGWKPMLWYVRDNRRGRFMLADRIEGTAPRKTLPTGDTDDWAQGVGELEPIISGLTAPGDLIVDPFAGSGSVGIAALRFGRRFIGADL